MEKIREFVEDDEKVSKLVKLLFETLDKDRSGTIKFNELNEALTSIGGNELNEESRMILDADNSDGVDYYELKEFVKQVLSRYLKIQ